ncbi:MAG: YihY/virulence factor BrkB family protein [Deltaproteobacteria bacterium]|nr:YihY/virulence factor BrkB family protein [Deltaproteobacteria bacterium]
MIRFFASVIGGLKIFFGTNCFSRSAAVSFYAIFSIMPLILLLTAGLGFIFGKNIGMLDKVIAFVKGSLPYINEKILSDIKDLSKIWKTLGWVSIFSLFWSAQFVLDGIASALTAVFETGHKFKFVRRKVVNILVALIALLAVSASVLISALAVILKSTSVASLGIDANRYRIFQGIAINVLLPSIVIALAVTFVYRIFAGPNLNLRYSFYGSVVFTVLWGVAKDLFALYLINFPTYNSLYASMGALMIFMVWIYFSVALFLYSAAFAMAAYERRSH